MWGLGLLLGGVIYFSKEAKFRHGIILLPNGSVCSICMLNWQHFKHPIPQMGILVSKSLAYQSSILPSIVLSIVLFCPGMCMSQIRQTRMKQTNKKKDRVLSLIVKLSFQFVFNCYLGLHLLC